MAQTTGQARVSWGIPNGLWPGALTEPHFLPGGIGPRALPLILDFTTGGSNGNAVSDSLYIDETNGKIGMLQSIFIDNSANPANSFSITFNATQQKISIPKNSQGIFPIIAPSPPQFIALTAGLVLVPVIFMNMPMAPMIWSAS